MKNIKFNKAKVFSGCMTLLLLIVGNTIQAQSLENYVDTALKNNPTIHQFELRYSIAQEKVNEASSLPNTDFEVGVFAIEPETRTGPQLFKVGVKQKFPWFGAITARENYAKSLADAQYEDIVIAKRQLLLEVSLAYYQLFAIKAQQSVLVENITLLKTYERLATKSVEVGNASAVDVLRLQIRQNDLKQEKEILQQRFIGEQAVFNRLLNRDGNIGIQLVDSLPIPEVVDNIKLEQLTEHPEILKYDKLFASVAESEIVNRKEGKASFGLGIDYTNIQKRTDMDFADNGKDALMPMVSLSIPLFNNKYRSTTLQNKLQQEEILTEKQDRQNRLKSKLSEAISKRQAAFIRYKTQSKNIQKTIVAESMLRASYETGIIDYSTVLDIEELNLKYKMDRIESIRDFYQEETQINYILD